MKLSSLLIALPLLAVPVALAVSQPALAAGAAEEAVRILSKARAADQKCNYLSAREKSELSRFAARAEIAAASQSSPKAAKSAAAAGRAEANAAVCSPDVATDVRETVEAARQAVAAANAGSDETEPKEKPVRRSARAAEPEPDELAPRSSGEGLGYYERVVKAYYLERQCRSLARRDADRFWKKIVRLHHSAVASNGKRAVARIMASAERQAARASCSGNVLARIEAGYREVSSR